MKKSMKKLYRSKDNKVWAGIFGGVGEYFDIDPALIRLLWIIIVICSGIIPALLAYFVALFIVPKNPVKPIKQAEK